MNVRAFDTEDQKIADEMFVNLKYLLEKYTWLEVYHGIWNTMANKMCGSVEASCEIISNRKQAEYRKLAEK